MKQKILIRVTMTDDKTRAKAMTKAVQFKGVSAVEIKGDHRNQIEVTGVEVDMIPLIQILRKKVAFAELVSVTKVEPPKKEDEKKGGDGKGAEGKGGDQKGGDKKGPDDKEPPEPKPVPCYPWPLQGYGVPSSFPHPAHPYNDIGEPVYNHEPNCKIM
nr:ATFP4-like [Arabidopsis thaliana]